jgi:hypothetical protein
MMMMRGITQHFSCRRHVSSSLLLLTSSVGAVASMTTSAAAPVSSSSKACLYGEKFKPSLVSTVAIKGRRPHMEDEVVVSDDHLYAAVFDGKNHHLKHLFPFHLK